MAGPPPLPRRRALLDLDVPDRRAQGLRLDRAAPADAGTGRGARTPSHPKPSRRRDSTSSRRSRASSRTSASSPSPATFSGCRWSRPARCSSCRPARSSHAFTGPASSWPRPSSRTGQDDRARTRRDRAQAAGVRHGAGTRPAPGRGDGSGPRRAARASGAAVVRAAAPPLRGCRGRAGRARPRALAPGRFGDERVGLERRRLPPAAARRFRRKPRRRIAPPPTISWCSISRTRRCRS